MKLSPEEKAAKILADPVATNEGLFGVKWWSGQKRLARAVVENRRVAIKKCHATGGTFMEAGLALWWAARYPNARVVITGPSWTNVEQVVFPTIHRLMDQSRRRVQAGQPGIPFGDGFKTEIHMEGNRRIFGLSTNEAERFKGFDRTHLLYIVDEANAVGTPIFEAIEGAQAGGHVHVLLVAQPELGSIGSKFHKAFHEDRERWKTFTTSAFQTPNFQKNLGQVGRPSFLTLDELLQMDPSEDGPLDDNPWPFLVTKRWVWEKFHEWGAGHPWWQSKVLGEFPESMEDSLITGAMIDRAKEVDLGVTSARMTCGVDPAGSGRDEFAARIWEGYKLGPGFADTRSDAMGRFLHWLEPYRKRLDWVAVDVSGLGYEVAGILEDKKYNVLRRHPQDVVKDKDRYANADTERAFALRGAIEDGEADLSALDEKTYAQMVTIRWTISNSGRLELESNKHRKLKRGLKSPDRFQATMLGFPASVGRTIDFRPGYLDEADVSNYRPPMAGMEGRTW